MKAGRSHSGRIMFAKVLLIFVFDIFVTAAGWIAAARPRCRCLTCYVCCLDVLPAAFAMLAFAHLV